MNLGLLFMRQGWLDTAIAEHRTAIKLNPASDLAHNSLGVALADQGKLGEPLPSTAMRRVFKPAISRRTTILAKPSGIKVNRMKHSQIPYHAPA